MSSALVHCPPPAPAVAGVDGPQPAPGLVHWSLLDPPALDAFLAAGPGGDGGGGGGGDGGGDAGGEGDGGAGRDGGGAGPGQPAPSAAPAGPAGPAGPTDAMQPSPDAPPPAPPAAPAEDPAAAPPVAAHLVLYIDDNPINTLLMAAMFERLPGLRLDCETDPLRGVQRALAEPPALLLIDIQMPGLDGFAVLRRLREAPATRDIPAIAVSANAMPQDVARGQAAGFVDYLTKPLEMDRLLQALQAALPGWSSQG